MPPEDLHHSRLRYSLKVQMQRKEVAFVRESRDVRSARGCVVEVRQSGEGCPDLEADAGVLKRKSFREIRQLCPQRLPSQVCAMQAS